MMNNEHFVKLKFKNDPWVEVGKAFDRKALVYDPFGENHPNLDRMRSKARNHLRDLLAPGSRLLEINAGTGTDAVYFASSGYRVHATDVSAEMISLIEKKAHTNQLEGQLTAQQCSFTELDQVKQGLFDGVFSNLGGVNCVQNLELITSTFPRLLKPGAVIVWVVMPPLCLWEFGQVLRGHFKLAFRRLHPGGIEANIEGLPVKAFYHWPRRVQAAFGPDFKPLKLEGLSVFTPPADHKSFARCHPKLYSWLVWIDDLIAGFYPFNRWGDFYCLSLKYQPTGRESLL
jgi:ubiquinone/menaquinone biosynthesis C-methylase UbiE